MVLETWHVPGQEISTRYTADQIVEAVGQARGDGRHFLVDALTVFPGPEREGALTRILDAELRADDRNLARAALAELRPEKYLRPFVVEGLHSRSIGIQQIVVASLPYLVGDGLESDLADEVEAWLGKRLRNPRRVNTWATWEITGVALALIPSRDSAQVWQLLDELAPKMQPEEQQRWHLTRAAADDHARIERLRRWHEENGCGYDDDREGDPTALVYVDRTMKRLGFTPANPESEPYDDLADDDTAGMYEFTVVDGELTPK